MRSLAVRVPRGRGEEVRRALRSARLLRSDLRVGHAGDDLLFPVRASPSELPPEGRLVEADFEPTPSPAAASYRDLLDLPEPEAALLPRAFDVVGDVVLIRLPDELASRAAEIGEALLRFVPGTRVVARDRGVEGEERVRQLERIAGEGGFRTRHRENGLEIEVDLARAYFSPRLAREHARIASTVRAGERFADLCCGVGPFALHVARDGLASSIVAVDSNPEATALLRENLRRLGLEGRVRVVEDRLERYLTSAPVSDRVVLNLPHEGIKYVTSVSATVEHGGTLHYFEVTSRAGRESRAEELSGMLQPRGDWTAPEFHVVHPYSPTSDVVAFTLTRNPT
jgi:tRNA (guanine37-N1)-methyltransferase